MVTEDVVTFEKVNWQALHVRLISFVQILLHTMDFFFPLKMNGERPRGHDFPSSLVSTPLRT